VLFPLLVLSLAAVQTPLPVPAAEPSRAVQGQEPSKQAPKAAPRQDPKPASPSNQGRATPSRPSTGGASGAQPRAPRTGPSNPGASPKATGEPKLKRRGS